MRFLIVFLSLLLISCTSDKYHSEFQLTSEDYTWEKNDVKSFTFSVDEVTPYNINISVRYLTGLRWDTLRLQWNLQKSNETLVTFSSIEIPVIDQNGKHIGEANFDIWQTENCLKEKINLEKGDYTIRIKHCMPEEILPYITEIGIELDKL